MREQAVIAALSKIAVSTARAVNGEGALQRNMPPPHKIQRSSKMACIELQRQNR
jgi:hypothetical protein